MWPPPTPCPNLPQVVAVAPLERPPDVRMRPPGSKSITNRALLCAAMAPGDSTLIGALTADDTRAMAGAITGLGARVKEGRRADEVVVTGIDPRTRQTAVCVDAGQSGTTARFILPVLALSRATAVLDGHAQLRRRPFGPLLEALRQLGATVEYLSGRPGYLPVAVHGPVHGDRVDVPGEVSSQFLSGLLLAGPLIPAGLRARLVSPLVSRPYLQITAAVMASFGIRLDGLAVSPGAYRPTTYAVEPDASAASYLWAAAAITSGRVTVEGLGADSVQGDVAFVDVLEQMGARIDRSTDSITVSGTGRLRGIDVDMADLSDTALTLATVAPFADRPTRVRGIGFIRGKESDRIAAITTELRRAGIDADAAEDGFTVHPGHPAATTFSTYQDHRMAMSLALLGLRTPGIRISDPGCVAKTYPGFFAELARMGA